MQIPESLVCKLWLKSLILIWWESDSCGRSSGKCLASILCGWVLIQTWWSLFLQ